VLSTSRMCALSERLTMSESNKSHSTRRHSSLARAAFIILGSRKRRILALALDQKIYELRLEKLKQIQALGQEAYPRKYATTHTVPQILEQFTPKAAEELEATKVSVS